MNAVQAKRCIKCAEQRPIDQFQANARYADGYVNWCKPCSAEYRKQHSSMNREKVRAQNADWHQANKIRRNLEAKARYAANPEAHAERVAAAKARRPDHYRSVSRINARRRRAERVECALRARISSQLRYCLTTGKGGATSEALLGYSINELRTHLERQFLKGMSWENMGEWHIDHIVPLSSFTITGPDDPELRRAWALPNLRPLWAKDNIRKGAKIEVML